MAGYTGDVYREILREFGCPFCYTDMVSAMGILQGGRDSEDILVHLPQDRPLALQVFGKDPDAVARAVLKIDTGSFDAIDLNCGCPARKVTSTGSGGALLKDPARAADIVTALKNVCDLPVTAKIRLGWDDPDAAPDIATRLYEAGLDMLVVHGRTVSQGFAGEACWDRIYAAAESVPIPVVGNGDVDSPEGAFRQMESRPLSGVMVGRALLGNPFFFRQCRDLMEGRKVSSPGPAERVAAAMDHFNRAIERHGPRRGLLEMRKHLAFYVRGLRGASRLREAINRETTPQGVLAILDDVRSEYADDAGSARVEPDDSQT